MKVQATLEIPGQVHLIARGAYPPHDKVVIRPVGETDDAQGGDLFIGGVQVAEKTYIVSVDHESVYEAGKKEPVDAIVHGTRLACVVEFNTEEVPF
jgi:hypothetical protein